MNIRRQKTDHRLQYYISHAIKVGSIELELVCPGGNKIHRIILYNFEYHWKQYRIQGAGFITTENCHVHESVAKLK